MSKYELLIHGDEAEYAEITPRLRLRKYGSWLISEKKKQDKIAKQRARQVLAVVGLAGKISVEKGISQEEAFTLINGIDNGSNINITSEYIKEVTELVESSMGQTESDAKTLTMFLASRAQGLIDGEWVRLADWGDEDTDVLDDGTREKIVAFINEEQSGGSEVKDDDDEEEEEAGAEGNEVKPPTSGKKSKQTASGSSNTETTGTAATQESPLVE
jgi:hypothetical protein